MKNIRNTCMEFFQNEDMRKHIKDIVKPIVDLMYNEMYYYVWFVCLYHVFLIFIILVNLVLLIKLLNTKTIASSPSI
uniref:Uncharacterized protein n=1 Tax=viral metagenome TaxID=1070528 RepID=A0A6C0KJE9_9ZZZZ